MKKRITIYLDEQVWTEFRIRCLSRGESASSAVEGLIVGGSEPPPKRSKEIAPKLEGDAKEVLEKLDSAKKEMSEPDVDLEAENAKLLERRKKIAELKKSGMTSASEIPHRSFFKKGGAK